MRDITYLVISSERESRETDRDIALLFNKVSRKPKRTLKTEQDPGKFMIPCSIHSHNLPNTLCDTGSAGNSVGMIKDVKVEIGEWNIHVDFHVVEIKSDEIVFYDPMEKKKKRSASIDREPRTSVDIQPATSIAIQFSPLVDKQPSESIDTKLSASVDTLQFSEQLETEKTKSGGRTRNRKKKRKNYIYVDFLLLVPLQCQEGSLEYKVRCRGGP
ncbi:hypothetical protein Bca101_067605 [Brassica carinata]